MINCILEKAGFCRRIIIQLLLSFLIFFPWGDTQAQTRPPQVQPTLCYYFTGVSGELLTNIQLRLGLNNHNCLTALPKEGIRPHFIKSKPVIIDALKPYGYFKPFVRGQLLWSRNGWAAVYSILPGEPLRISSIQVKVKGEGEYNPAILKYINHLPIKPGDVFNTPNYTEVKNKLFNTARNQGYIKAFFQNKILIDLKRYTCQIYIELNTGDLYYFGPIIFDNDVYSQAFLKRFVCFKESMPFSSKSLVRLQQAMENSYYFQEVIITPDFNHINNHHVPVHIGFTLPKAKEYNLGIGYGTLTGPRISGGLSLRRVTNTGQHFEAQMKLSTVLSTVVANYYIPGRDPLAETYLLGANAKRFNPNAGKSDSVTFTAAYLLNREKIRQTMSLNFLIDRFNVDPNPARTSHLFYPSYQFVYFSGDNLVHPRNGFSFTFNIDGAAQPIVSTTSYVQPQTKAKFVFSPFTFARFILRGELGYTAVHDLPKFPLSQRFFAGGMNSIRGFADSSIGPGRYLKVGSVEYQNKLMGNLNAAVFYDIGTAANHFNDPLNRGAGIGLVYDSVVGPAKIYLARAISKKSQPYSVEFSIGPEFS